VSHGGGTAAYRAHVALYPDQRVAVAVLCNASDARAAAYARAVAELYLGSSLQPPPARLAPRHSLSNAERQAVVGLYRNTETREPLSIVTGADGVRAAEGPALVAQSASRFQSADGRTWELNGSDLRVVDQYGSVFSYARVEPARPGAAELQPFTGSYASDEANVALTLAVDGGTLVIRRSPGTTLPLTPAYADVFTSPELGTVVFKRDDSGRVQEFAVVQERVWALRFTRQNAAPPRSAIR
jgi:hypothetical protein